MEMDLASSVSVESGLNIQDISSDTTTQGNIIDSGDFESLTFALYTGTIADGDYALILEDGDDSGLSDAATVGADFIVGTLPSFTEDTDDNSAAKCGYVGKKRYVRASVVSTNTTQGGTLGVLAIKGHAGSRPTA